MVLLEIKIRVEERPMLAGFPAAIETLSQIALER